MLLSFFFLLRQNVDFKVFTVATNETDGFKQFMRSSKIYNIPLEVCIKLKFMLPFFF